MTVGSASYKVSLPMVVQHAQLLPNEYANLDPVCSFNWIDSSCTFLELI
jgi:hypothetical protein